MTGSRRAAAEDALCFWDEAFVLALHLTGERARAEDLCQEALLRLLRMKRAPDRSRPLRALYLKIVRHLAYSEGRRLRPESLDRALDVGGPLVDDAAVDPLEETTRREEIATVEAALAQLSPLWRAILYLRDGLGLSYREVAEVLDRSEDVVRVTLHRARLRIRAALTGLLIEGREI